MPEMSYGHANEEAWSWWARARSMGLDVSPPATVDSLISAQIISSVCKKRFSQYWVKHDEKMVPIYNFVPKS
jgi:L-rhamnose isomerase